MLKGWDFEELADEWGLYLPDSLDDYSEPMTTAEWINLYLENFIQTVSDTRTRRKAAKDIRKYCQLMSDDDCCFECPVWEGMAKVEDDFTLIRLFSPLIGYAWT